MKSQLSNHEISNHKMKYVISKNFVENREFKFYDVPFFFQKQLYFFKSLKKIISSVTNIFLYHIKNILRWKGVKSYRFIFTVYSQCLDILIPWKKVCIIFTSWVELRVFILIGLKSFDHPVQHIYIYELTIYFFIQVESKWTPSVQKFLSVS